METSGDPLRRLVDSIPETSIPSEIDPNLGNLGTRWG